MAISSVASVDPPQLDGPSFSQTTRKGPLVVHWRIEPDQSKTLSGSDRPTQNRPAWKITAQLEAPSDWKLATASSDTRAIEKISSEPLVLAFAFHEPFPPLGPGPSLDTQWKTPGGPTYLRLEPELTAAAIVEIPAPPDPPPSAHSSPILWLLLAIPIFLLGLHFWRRRPTIEALARQWYKTAPASEAPWPQWETWLARVDREWNKQSLPNQGAWPAEWKELGEILPQARFGRPHNPSCLDMMGKIKILGRMDNLVKLRVVGRR